MFIIRPLPHIPTWLNEQNMASRVVAVAMSGGVDSTVTALLLKKTGRELVGVYMHNWEEINETGHCSSQTNWQNVQALCRDIKIPCTRVNFVKEYWNHVFSSLLDDVRCGLTPNPDILCNQFVKFKALHCWVRDTLGVATIATGHYARVNAENGETQLLRGVDSFKDQTYFLSQISQESLQNTLFPVGHMTKAQVRAVAREEGMNRVNEQKESMGLCFVGKREFKRFISQYIESVPGHFVTPSGKIVGKHEGHHLYTVGQRARLGGHHYAYFVAGKDAQSNTVTVVEGTSHPALYSHSLTTLPPHWITRKSHDLISHSDTFECLVRLRHQHPLVPCVIQTRRNDGGLHVVTKEPLRAVTPGQYAVFYRQMECLGGACIAMAGPSLAEQTPPT